MVSGGKLLPVLRGTLSGLLQQRLGSQEGA